MVNIGSLSMKEPVRIFINSVLNLVKLIFWSAKYICSLNSIKGSGIPNKLRINSMDLLVPFDLNK